MTKYRIDRNEGQLPWGFDPLVQAEDLIDHHKGTELLVWHVQKRIDRGIVRGFMPVIRDDDLVDPACLQLFYRGEGSQSYDMALSKGIKLFEQKTNIVVMERHAMS
jgi:hypothetical protein